MATQVSSDAEKVLSGLDSSVKNYILSQGTGDKLTSGEARSLLAAYQADPSKALSASNISATQTSPTPAPDDLLGQRASISSQLGIPDLETKYQDAYKTLKNFDLETENTSRLIKEQQLSTNALSGREATLRAQRSSERLGYATEAEIAQSALIAAKQELETRYGILAQNVSEMRQLIVNNPGAGITFSDTAESASKKIAEYKKKTEKENYKTQLKDKLISLGISTKNSKGGSLNTSKMEKALKEYYKEQGASDKELKNIELLIKKKQLNSTGSSNSANEKKLAQLNSDIDEWRSKMVTGKANWSMAFDSIKRTYGLDTEDVDSLLGTSYRDQFDKPIE